MTGTTINRLRKKAADLGLRLKRLRRPRWAGMPVKYTISDGRGLLSFATIVEAERFLAKHVRRGPVA